MNKFMSKVRGTRNYAVLANFVNKNTVRRIGGAALINKNFNDTEGHNSFVVNASSVGFSFGDDDRVERTFRAFFAATSAYLKVNKIASEDQATALVLTDSNGNFKFAAYIRYYANEEETGEPGNWAYEMTTDEGVFNEVDNERNVKKTLYGDPAFRSVFLKVAYDVAAIEFQADHFVYDACMLCVDTIMQVLDGEAVEGETVEIEFPGYFMAKVSVEGGEKVFSIEPAGQMKALAKGDKELEDVTE